MTEQKTIQVAGMSCQQCVTTIEDKVNKIPGVKSVTVNLDSGSVDLSYNASIVGLIRISKMIEDQGYNVTT